MKPTEIEQRMAAWKRGQAQLGPDGVVIQSPQVDLAAKLRRAYDWLAHEALVCPYADIEFGDRVTLGSADNEVECRRGAAYSSYVLLPLLNLVVGQRLLLVGAPGRGKTTVATLMGLLAGGSLQEVRRCTQHGHPQLTIADLLGSPLPSQLIEAKEASAIRVSWRRWLTGRVKIVDEYNRIPTKTQSALLSLMAEGYAEQYEQVVESGPSAWFLTANDDLGGGTFEVIAALKDRIDIVVRAVPFSSYDIDHLAERITDGRSPQDVVPSQLVFSDPQLAQLAQQVRAVPVEPAALEALGLLSAQLDFCRQGSRQLEYMSKDTVHLAGKQLAHVCTEDCPLDKHENICSQTEHGISARAHLSTLLFAKALAFFRGAAEVTLEDLRVVLPWTLHHKLRPNQHSVFFHKQDHRVFLTDRVAWVQQLVDRCVAQAAGRVAVRGDVVRLLEAPEPGRGMTAQAMAQELSALERAMANLSDGHELNALVHRDLVALKRRHALLRSRS